ncbi:hypothetical protein NQ318_009722 [Aromia moschata]|uniref:DUF4817 domain-containing protein n=1 Tax=Aromia moschata TaxID=1265417 RepID=A0AAV8Y348_9CUCU|nr:hypothetical protein NQ318_009722 [Aromia moschata]
MTYANFNGHEAVQRYLQLYPNKRQPNHKLFRNLYNRLGETGSIRPKCNHGTPKNITVDEEDFNSCFGKSRSRYLSVKCGNGAKPIVHL